MPQLISLALVIKKIMQSYGIFILSYHELTAAIAAKAFDILLCGIVA